MNGKRLSLVLAVAVLSAGCGAPAATAPALSPTASSSGVATAKPSPTIEPTSTATSSPPLDLSEPPVKAQLHASDPTSAQLANGQPTLVEFFAFW